MAARNGVPTIIKIASRLCQLIVIFTPVIQKQFPGSTALHTALALANTACADLVVQAALVREYGD